MSRDPDTIVEKVLQGDIDAFGGIIDLYQRDLWAIVSYLIKDRWLAEEIVQRTYVKAYSSLGEYRSGNFGAWLKEIARNEMRMELRRARNEMRKLLRYADRVEVEAASCELEAASVEQVESRARHLRECVKKLPAHLRSLLDLRYRVGRSSKDIADETRRTPEAIRKALSRVIASVRDCILGRELKNA